MVEKTCMWVTVGIIFIFAVSGTGQEEQWLQYQSSRDASSTLRDVSYQRLNLISQWPEKTMLPVFKEEKPLFYKWPSPMVKNGYLLIAMDCNQAGGVHDLLYIDSNGDESLKDETVIQAYQAEREHSNFGPVKVIFEGKDGPTTYHLNFRLCDHGEKPLWASCAGWYEGTITVEEAKKQCVLIDYDANGTFNDKSINFDNCDRIRIGDEDSKARFVGNFIEIDGALYRLEVAQDGANVKIAKAEDVVFGNVRLPQIISEFSAGGENGLFDVKLENGLGKLPVGKYRIEHWTIERRDEAGSWKLEGGLFGNAGVFDVSAEKQAELSIGEPAICTLEVREDGAGYSFSRVLTGQLGERVWLTCNGGRPPAPKLHIKSKDGKYDRTFSFEYG